MTQRVSATTPRALDKALSVASSYSEWKAIAQQYDTETGGDDWRERDKSKHFDYANIRARLEALRAFALKR